MKPNSCPILNANGAKTKLRAYTNRTLLKTWGWQCLLQILLQEPSVSGRVEQAKFDDWQFLCDISISVVSFSLKSNARFLF